MGADSGRLARLLLAGSSEAASVANLPPGLMWLGIPLLPSAVSVVPIMWHI